MIAAAALILSLFGEPAQGRGVTTVREIVDAFRLCLGAVDTPDRMVGTVEAAGWTSLRKAVPLDETRPATGIDAYFHDDHEIILVANENLQVCAVEATLGEAATDVTLATIAAGLGRDVVRQAAVAPLNGWWTVDGKRISVRAQPHDPSNITVFFPGALFRAKR